MRKRTTCRSRRTTGDNYKALYASVRHAGHVARRATSIRPCAQAHDMPVASHNGNNDKASCASAPGFSAIVRKRTSFQPLCASARAFSHRAQAHELSAIVRKRTSFQPSCASAQAFSHRAQAHELQRLLWVCINCLVVLCVNWTSNRSNQLTINRID